MKPLSAFKFITGNPKKTLPIIVSLTIGIFLVYFYSLMVTTTASTGYMLNSDIYKNYTMVYSSNSDTLPSTFLDGAKNCDGVGKVIPTAIKGSLRYKNGMGSYSAHVFGMFSQDTEDFISSLDMKLVSGELPKQGQSEVLISAKLAAQEGVKVDDFIGSAVNDSCMLQGKYRVCGIIEGPEIFAVTCNIPGGVLREDYGKKSVFLKLTDPNSTELKSMLEALPQSAVVEDFKSIKGMIDTDIKALDMSFAFITVMMVIVLCIAITNLNSIIFSNRRGEFAMLHAMGYKKSRLMAKLWCENIVSCLTGYVTGILFTMLVGELINLTLYKMQGKALDLYNQEGLKIALIVPMFVSIISLLPCLTAKFSIEEAQGT
jgi:putative ABC transport system permease protein